MNSLRLVDGSSRRKQRRRLIVVGLGLTLGALVLLAFVYPPSFLSWSSQERPPSGLGQPAPAITDKPEARIAIAGDTGTRSATEAATARRMELEAERQGKPYDALILLGDIVYQDGDSALTRQSVTDPFAPILEAAELIPMLGNHDVRSDEEDGILSELGRESAWYVERVGPLRVIVLDSNRVDDEEQNTWLRQVLAEEQPAGTWTVAAMHHAPFSAGQHGSNEDIQRAWVPLFAQAGLPLVLAGHDHDYERSYPQGGVTYVVSGAGAKLRRVGREDFTAVSTSTLHFLELLVYEDRLEGRAIDQQGNLIDKFTINR